MKLFGIQHDEMTAARATLMKVLVEMRRYYGFCWDNDMPIDKNYQKQVDAVRYTMRILDDWVCDKKTKTPNGQNGKKKLDQVYDAFPADKIEVIGG